MLVFLENFNKDLKLEKYVMQLHEIVNFLQVKESNFPHLLGRRDTASPSAFLQLLSHYDILNFSCSVSLIPSLAVLQFALQRNHNPQNGL